MCNRGGQFLPDGSQQWIPRPSGELTTGAGYIKLWGPISNNQVLYNYYHHDPNGHVGDPTLMWAGWNYPAQRCDANGSCSPITFTKWPEQLKYGCCNNFDISASFPTSGEHNVCPQGWCRFGSGCTLESLRYCFTPQPDGTIPYETNPQCKSFCNLHPNECASVKTSYCVRNDVGKSIETSEHNIKVDGLISNWDRLWAGSHRDWSDNALKTNINLQQKLRDNMKGLYDPNIVQPIERLQSTNCTTYCDSGQCDPSEIISHCRGDNLKTQACKNYYKIYTNRNGASAFDDNIREYCKSKINDMSEEDVSICGCHMPEQTYIDFWNALEAQSGGRVPAAYRSVSCAYPACVSGAYSTFHGDECPDIQQCIQNIDISFGKGIGNTIEPVNRCISSLTRNVTGTPQGPAPESLANIAAEVNSQVTLHNQLIYSPPSTGFTFPTTLDIASQWKIIVAVILIIILIIAQVTGATGSVLSSASTLVKNTS